MSVAEQLLADLNEHGIAMHADGEKLRFRPAKALTADLRARVIAAKPQLLKLLSASREAPTRFEGESIGLREVLGLQADLLSALPLQCALVVLPERAAIRSDSPRWASMVKACPANATVGTVLARCGLQLLAVVLHGTGAESEQ